ncbi:MAG: ABC transporter ATP-binding protein [Roseovarius sp.]|nr:ABC transporter ATP-binding protein [Roseovarius sp.]
MQVSMLTLAQGMAAAATAFATRGLFEALQSGQALPLGLLALLSGAGLIIAGTRVAARRAGERLGQRFALAIRLALLEHAAGMPASAVADRRSGYMSLRFVGDMTAFRNWPGLGLPRLIAGAVMIPSACLVLWLLDPAFALAAAPILGLTVGILAWAGPRLAPYHFRLRAHRARIAADMAERMPLAPDLDRLGQRPAELRNLRRRTNQMIRAGLARLTFAESLKALPDAAAGLGAAAILMAGASTGADTGSIAGALAALGLVLSPMRDLASVWNIRAAYLTAREKCRAALNRPQRALYEQMVKLPKGAVSVMIRDLPLRTGKPLSFDLPAGTRLTLPCSAEAADHVFSTLCGLENVAPARIMLSGFCLTDLSRGSLRRGVQRLSATPVVLRGSLRRNLALGLTRTPEDARLIRACGKAGLAPLLDRIGGLDGIISEGGRNLSSAERCALSLARLLLGKPQLILIDTALWLLSEDAQIALSAFERKSGATVLLHPALHSLSPADASAIARDKSPASEAHSSPPPERATRSRAHSAK